MRKSIMNMKAVRMTAVVVLAGVLTVSTAPTLGQTNDPIWQMEGGDGGRTNQSALLAPQGTMQKLWKVDLGADSFCQPAIGADGTIYVTNDIGQLIAVSPQGQKKWTFSGTSIRASSPAVGADGTIYFGTGDYVTSGNNAYAYAVNPDGTERWRYNIGSAHPYAPLIDEQDRVHFATWTRSYYCLNVNGSLAWTTTGSASSRPALLPGGNTVLQDSTYYRCLDSSGDQVWKVEYGYNLEPPIAASNGTIYAATYDSEVWVIDPATGSKQQTIDTGYNASKALSIDEQAQRIYVSYDSGLLSFDLDGNLKWSYGPTGGRSGPALIDAAGNLLVSQGQNGNDIDCLSPSGSLLWYFESDEGGHHFCAPSLGPGGVVYATNWTSSGSSGYLYAIVPEPATMSLLAVGAIALIRRRKK